VFVVAIGSTRNDSTKSKVSKRFIDNEIGTKAYFFLERDEPGQDSITTAVFALIHQLLLADANMVVHARESVNRFGDQIRQLLSEQ
jgi:hypothetical protein